MAQTASLKGRLGRVAYIWTGAKSLRVRRSRHDPGRREPLVQGPGELHPRRQHGRALRRRRGIRRCRAGRRHARPRGDHRRRASPQWARTVGRTVAGHPERSPYFRVTKARKVKVKLDRKVLYELDGGARTKVKAYGLAVEPGAITVCVPAGSRNGGNRMSSMQMQARSAGRSDDPQHGVRGADAGRVRRPRPDLRHHRRCSRSRSRSTRPTRATNQRGAMRDDPEAAVRPLAPDRGGGRPGRLRGLAVRPGLRRPRPGGRRRRSDVRPAGRGGEWLRIRGHVRARGARSCSAPRARARATRTSPPPACWDGREGSGSSPPPARSSSASRSTRDTRACRASSSRRTRPGRWARSQALVHGAGVVGHLARMVAFGLIGVFVLKAAIDYAPNKAVGLDGALRSSPTRPTARSCSRSSPPG